MLELGDDMISKYQSVDSDGRGRVPKNYWAARGRRDGGARRASAREGKL
jgi:hypothetical protein